MEVEVDLIAYLSQTGLEREAQELCERLLGEASDDTVVVTQCAILAALRGDRSEAERFEALIGDDGQIRGDQLSNTYNRICIAAQLGDTERAVDLLRQLIARAGWCAWDQIRRDPDLAPLRDSTAFQELLRPKG